MLKEIYIGKKILDAKRNKQMLDAKKNQMILSKRSIGKQKQDAEKKIWKQTVCAKRNN